MKMPIKRTEFEMADALRRYGHRNTIKQKLHDFLKQNEDLAYSYQELAKELGVRKTSLIAVANDMLKLGMIQRKYEYTQGKDNAFYQMAFLCYSKEFEEIATANKKMFEKLGWLAKPKEKKSKPRPIFPKAPEKKRMTDEEFVALLKKEVGEQ